MTQTGALRNSAAHVATHIVSIDGDFDRTSSQRQGAVVIDSSKAMLRFVLLEIISTSELSNQLPDGLDISVHPIGEGDESRFRILRSKLNHQ
jgi:hypothetical protein